MSLDNVPAVAANFVARLLKSYRCVGYLGLVVIVYVATQMIWHGSMDIDSAMKWELLPNAIIPN